MADTTAAPARPSIRFETLVELEAAGEATSEQLELLQADADTWLITLERLILETERGLDSVRSLTGPERDQVVADFETERTMLRKSLARLRGEPDPVLEAERQAQGLAPTEIHDPSILGIRALQTSWSPGRVVIWAAGPEAVPAGYDDLRDLLAAVGAPVAAFTPHAPVALPDGTFADALVAPVGDILGWLVATGAEAARAADPSVEPASGPAGQPAGSGPPIGAS